MLKLLIFAPCEKVIIGEDKLASIIAVMQHVNVAVDENMPADALAPLQWNAFVMWRRVEDVDAPMNYRQKMEVFRPDGVSVGIHESIFEVSNAHYNYRNVMRLGVLPIGMEGDVLLKLFLREVGEGIEWQEVAEYPIRITRSTLKEANEKQQTTNVPPRRVLAFSRTDPQPAGGTEEGSGQTEGKV
ncbi:MAG TPA: hypothetical protein VGP08_09270 [Pyrinomonadaceae bacterium]|jgi:hypothetical protein|nr:hypothetical protein [Pyrinomonadaceae bacterium]